MADKVDYSADYTAARLAQVDARLADLKAEQDELTEKRKAYAPKRSTATKKD